MKNLKFRSICGLTLIAVMINGCGGGGSTPTINTNDDTPVDIEVERGKVYDANVTDVNGVQAQQQGELNIYRFQTEPAYPITVNGGWIDIDGDGNMTNGVDLALDINLTTYSGRVVTPITTYIADANETIRGLKLQELMTEVGATSQEELLQAPSKGSSATVIAANAIYKVIKEKEQAGTYNLANFGIDDINSTLTDLKTTYNQSFTAKSGAELARDFESQVVSTYSSIFSGSTLDPTKIAILLGSRPNEIPIIPSTPTQPSESIPNTQPSTEDGTVIGGIDFGKYNNVLIYKNTLQTFTSSLPYVYEEYTVQNREILCEELGFTMIQETEYEKILPNGTKTYCTQVDFSRLEGYSGTYSVIAGRNNL